MGAGRDANCTLRESRSIVRVNRGLTVLQARVLPPKRGRAREGKREKKKASLGVYSERVNGKIDRRSEWQQAGGGRPVTNIEKRGRVQPGGHKQN